MRQLTFRDKGRAAHHCNGGRLIEPAKNERTSRIIEQLVAAGKLLLLIHGGDFNAREDAALTFRRVLRSTPAKSSMMPWLFAPASSGCGFRLMSDS
jgi:hypothetical protein